ncbi:transcription factor bHLH118-like [Primulina eburnea]|uniref:transcription factor bHLH118-like n=1 Tax=Primulina eburnea TaxID=1245227 RepID=UPI003C6C174A
MFDLRSGVELSFVTKSISGREDKLSFDDLISDQASLGCNVHSTTATATSSTTIGTQKQRFIEFGVEESITEKKNELGIRIRKNERRDLEKRRRNEMANLYASLQTLIPFECIKGKRSISDHMHEAVNYIKHKKKNIQDLKIRRDQLKELSDISENSKHSVTVNVETRGVEILIHSCLENRSFRISTVFVEIMERGLDVVAWITTTVNGKFFHKIQAESSITTYIDPSVLQERLIYVINN